MRYRLEIDPDVRAYLAGVPLTREGRVRLHVALNDLVELPDAYRTDPDNRQGNLFAFLHAFLDAGRYRIFRALVDDSSAVYGVLRIVYADLT